MEPIKLLLENKADINSSDEYGNTILMLATGEQHFETVKFLLESKADPNLRSIDGKTALTHAHEYHSPDIYKLLKQYGAE